MNNKGLTLIELLAVIVIIGLLATIAIPVMNNVIKKSERDTFETNARGVVRAAGYEFKRLELAGVFEPEIIFTFENGKETSNVLGAKLEYDGKEIKDGIVKINDEGQVAIAIYDNKNCAYKNYYENDVTIEEKTLSECKKSIASSFTCGDDFTDPRDGEVYKTTKIGDQCWFAEDLRYDCSKSGYTNVGSANSWSGSNNCGNQGSGYKGLLYQWPVAMDGSTEEGPQGLCPYGWHIPTDNEWKILEGTVDSTYGVGNKEWDKSNIYRGNDAGKKLKAVVMGGTDDYGFSALPAGYRNTSGSIYNVGSNGGWWTSSLSGSNAWRRGMHSSSDGVNRGDSSQSHGRSVRCVLGH